MLLLNAKLTADEAVTFGLVSKIVPPEKMESQVWSTLRRNAADLSAKVCYSPIYVAANKRNKNRAVTQDADFSVSEFTNIQATDASIQ